MRVFDEELSRASEDLASTLQAVLREPAHNDSIRIRVSHLACGLSLEHSVAARQLLVHALIPSALVVLRAQYEALVRAVWTLYAATDTQIEKLAAALDVDSDQAAKNLPQVRDMIVSMEKKAPPQAYQTLANFKDASWNALNSYVHAGIHPPQRRAEGYPLQLVEQMLKNSNGLALIAGMQTAVLTGNQQVVRRIGTLQESHRSCLPSR